MSGKEDESCNFAYHVSQTVEESESQESCFIIEEPPTATNFFLSEHEKHQISAHLQEELNLGVRELRDVILGSKLDFLEVCAPEDSPLTEAIRAAGGKALSLGLHNGYGLTTRHGYLKVLHVIRTLKPRYVHVSPLVGHGHPFRIAIRKLMNRRCDFRKNETRVGNCCTIAERSLKFNLMKCVVMVVVILVMLDMLVENILYMRRVGRFMT